MDGSACKFIYRKETLYYRNQKRKKEQHKKEQHKS